MTSIVDTMVMPHVATIGTLHTLKIKTSWLDKLVSIFTSLVLGTKGQSNIQFFLLPIMQPLILSKEKKNSIQTQLDIQYSFNFGSTLKPYIGLQHLTLHLRQSLPQCQGIAIGFVSCLNLMQEDLFATKALPYALMNNN